MVHGLWVCIASLRRSLKTTSQERLPYKLVDLPNGKNNASMSLPSDCPSTNLEQAPAAILVLSVVGSRLRGACRLLVVVSTLSGVYQYIRHAISWYNSQGSHVSTGQKIYWL